MELQEAVRRADLLYDSKRWDLAIAEYQRCLSMDPNNDWAHHQIAMCLTSQDKFAQALPEAERAVELDPEHPHYHYLCSFLLRRLSRVKDAIKHAHEAVDLMPDHAEYHAELAHCQLELGMNDKADFESLKAVELEPNNESVWHTRAIVLLNTGKIKAAHEAVDRMMEIDPENWRAHHIKGLLLKKEGKFSDSVRYYREALRIDPTSKWARQGYMDALRGRSPAYSLLVFFSQARMPRFFYFNLYVVLVIFVIFGLLAVVAVLVKAASPHLLNSFLAFDPEGKDALDRQEQKRAQILGVYTLAQAACGFWLLFHLMDRWMPAAFLLLYLTPVLVTRIFEFSPDSPYRRYAMIYVAAGMVFGAAGMALSVVSPDSIYTLNTEHGTLADIAALLTFVFFCFCLFARGFWKEHESFY